MVEKGPVFRDLDTFLQKTHYRQRLLDRLAPLHRVTDDVELDRFVNTLVDTPGIAWQGNISIPAATAVGIADGRETVRWHLRQQWFGGPPNPKFFSYLPLGPTTDAQRWSAAEVVRSGFVDALLLSLGKLHPGDQRLRDFPIDVLWVCGKNDSFQAILSVRRLQRSGAVANIRAVLPALKARRLAPFKGGLVTLLLITPPVASNTSSFPPGADRNKVFTDNTGMLVIDSDAATGVVANSVVLPVGYGGADQTRFI